MNKENCIPGYTKPAQVPEAGDIDQYNKYQMEGGSSIDFWKGLKESLKSMVQNVQSHINGLSSTTTEAQNYFISYLDGNKISSSFYR